MPTMALTHILPTHITFPINGLRLALDLLHAFRAPGIASNIPRGPCPDIQTAFPNGLGPIIDQAVHMAIQHTIFPDPVTLVPSIALIITLISAYGSNVDFTDHDVRDIVFITHISSRLSTLSCLPPSIILQLSPSFYIQLTQFLRHFIPHVYRPSRTPWEITALMAAWEPLWRLSANTITHAAQHAHARRALEALRVNPTEDQFYTSVGGISAREVVEAANPALRSQHTYPPVGAPITPPTTRSSQSVPRRIYALVRQVFGVRQSRLGDVEVGYVIPDVVMNGIPGWMPLAAAIMAASLLNASGDAGCI